MADTSRVSREKPQGAADAAEASNRGGRYGEQYSIPAGLPRQALADEGSYFVAVNATPGTAIAVTGTITTFTDLGTTCGALFLKNTESKTASFPKRIYLDYIKLICLTAPTSAVHWCYAIVMDDNPVRLTSGGTALVCNNVNMDSSVLSIASGSFGALVIAAAQNRRMIARGNLKGTIPVLYDVFYIVAGQPGVSNTTVTTENGVFVESCPPIILGPQQNLLLSMWGVSNNAASTWEHEIGWWER